MVRTGAHAKVLKSKKGLAWGPRALCQPPGTARWGGVARRNAYIYVCSIKIYVYSIDIYVYSIEMYVYSIEIYVYSIETYVYSIGFRV